MKYFNIGAKFTYSKIEMAPKDTMLLQKIINERRRRRRLLQESLTIATARRRLLLKTCLLVLLLIFKGNCSTERVYHRSCRRLLRANTGWWKMVWESYSDKRFKQTLRVNRSTFNIILSHIRHRLERETVTEEPIITHAQPLSGPKINYFNLCVVFNTCKVRRLMSCRTDVA